jgi:hypothetical protein
MYLIVLEEGTNRTLSSGPVQRMKDLGTLPASLHSFRPHPPVISYGKQEPEGYHMSPGLVLKAFSPIRQQASAASR